MTDAFILDHVRTPRGRGRADGSLHHITPIQLAAQTLAALRDRNALDTRALDDVVLGCVSPIGEQGADIARVAALVAGLDESVPGKQLNRFCASGLGRSYGRGAGDVRSVDLTIGGGVESMSRVPMGSDGAWASAGAAWRRISYRGSAPTTRDARRLRVRGSMPARSKASVARPPNRRATSIDPSSVRDVAGDIALARDEYLRPSTTLADLANSSPPSWAGGSRVRRRRHTALPAGPANQHVHGGHFEWHRHGAAAVLVGNRKAAAGRVSNRARIRAFASIGGSRRSC
jgi:acetyl-CoA C-acetyltransferase